MTREEKNKAKSEYKQHTYGMWISLLLLIIVGVSAILFNNDLNPYLLAVCFILSWGFFYYSVLSKQTSKHNIIFYKAMLYIDNQNYYLNMIVKLIETEEGKEKAVEVYNKHILNKGNSTAATFILGVFTGAKCNINAIDNIEYHTIKKIKF